MNQSNPLPKISVTIPALNEEANLSALFEGFRNQTIPREDFEVIIVDNGSCDRTREIVQDETGIANYRLRLLAEDKKGVGYARRKGMNDAAERGIRYLAGTDADSSVPPTWIADILNMFEKTGADCLFGSGEWDLSGFASRPDLQETFKEALMVRLALSKHVMMRPRGVNFAITKEMYEKIGGMPQPADETGKSRPGEDVQLSKLVEQHDGKIATIGCVVKTSPRRLMQALLNNTPNHYYADDTDMRNEADLYKAVLAIDLEKAQDFFDATIKRVFGDSILSKINTEAWEKAKQFVAPREKEFVQDAATMGIDEIYAKYKALFISNAKSLQ